MAHSAAGGASLDGYAVKLTSAGALVWQIFLDDALLNGSDGFFSVAETTTGDFVMAGNTDSWGSGFGDGWMVKINSAGALLWQKTYGDALQQHVNGMIISADGGLVFAGGSSTPATGKSDIWVGKTDINGDFDENDCSTVISSTATAMDPLFVLGDPGKVSGNFSFTYQNGTHARQAIISSAIETSSYCPSYLEISGDAATIAGNNNELTIVAYDTAGAIRTNYSGAKTLTFSGLANDGVRFPTVEGTVFGTSQTVNFTGGISDALTTTLVPQIPEAATVSVTDGKLDCNAVNSEAPHCLTLSVRAPLKTWSELFESGGHDQAKTVKTAPDGNYILGSYTPAVVTVQKLDLDGVVIWETALGDAGTVTLANLEVMRDGSILVGLTSSAAGTNDFVAVKLDSTGNILWQNVYDNGGYADNLQKILLTRDDGLIMIGQSNVDPFAAPFHEGWVVRLDSSGNVVWQNMYGQVTPDFLSEVYEKGDGSFVIAGWTQTPTEYLTWVFNVDNTGKLLWSNSYDFLVNDPTNGPGTSSSAEIFKIGQSAAVGKLILAGRNFVANSGSYDEAILLQIDAFDGSLDWVYNYGDGTVQSDSFYDIFLSGANYMVAGASIGFGTGDYDGTILKISAFSQNASMAKALGGSTNNLFYSFDSTLDGGLILAGRHQHPIPPPGLKQSDIWVVKTDAVGEITDPNCMVVNDILPALLRVIPGDKVTDNSAAVTVTGVIAPSSSGTLSNLLTGLSKFSFCTSYFSITGAASMMAGTTNELTVTAYDYLGNVVASYDGPKYLTFSGLGSIGAYNPSVEGNDFGSLTRIDFVAGASTLAGSTLTAYKDEIATVHASDDVITSEPHDGTPDGGLPLTVGYAALDHYGITATTPQYAYFGWPETVTAYDLFGNVAKFNSAFTATTSGHAKFYDSGAYSAVNNVYNLVNGVAKIFLLDTYIETMTITASDAAAKTGTSGVITLLPPPAGGGGTGGSGPSLPVAGGSSSGGFPEPNLPPSAPFLSSAESTEPPSLACLQQATPEHDFADLTNHYAQNAINILGHTKNGDNFVVSGYEDQNGAFDFKPDQDVSRAEFLKMALVANCIPIDSVDPINPPARLFYDVPLDPNIWYSNFVYSAANSGIVSGYQDGNFYPERHISRAEAVKILVNIQKLIGPEYQPASYFVDVTKNDWFFAFVSAGKENDLLVGDLNANGDNVFRPFDHISRADSALILVRIYGLRDYLSLGDSNATTYSFL